MKVFSLNDLRDEVHKTAKDKGWYEGKQATDVERHMLIVTEIAEATEEARKGTGPVYFDTEHGRVDAYKDLGGCFPMKVGDVPQKPEGELIELADALIRILDYCGSKHWDIASAVAIKNEYNKTRTHRHGGKKL